MSSATPKLRLKVLHVTPSFYPATFYGGPIFSTHALCNAMARRSDIELRVLTTEANGPDNCVPVATLPLIYPAGYEVYVCKRYGRADFSLELLSRLRSLVAWADVVQLTGVYSFPTLPTLLAARILGKPVFWSPRGALLASQNWSQASRVTAKRIWNSVCSGLASSRTLLHVTSVSEREASLTRISCSGAVIIPNGADVPDELSPREWVPKGRLRLMFIGRLHPVKAVERLIEALKLESSYDYQLDIYGAGDAGYTLELKALAAPLGDRVRFHGHVEGSAKTIAFANADICILPSFTENFSMVVAESLAHGVPVIVSKGAPWADIELYRCGLWVNNSPQSLSAAIDELRSSDLSTMGARGRAWMIKEFGWDSLADRTVLALERLIHSKGNPISNANARSELT